jgi:beta-lactamase regulating signal transducer with metallopeptidase domain
MIFALRAIMVSLAFFALLYSGLSVLLVLAWKALSFSTLRKRMAARSLFGLRVFPFVLSAAISLFLVLPSFLVLEAHSMDEDLETAVLCACAMLILGAGVCRVLTAQALTQRIVSACLQDATSVGNGAVRVAVSRQTVSPFMLVGLSAPRILISESARNLLSDTEFAAAVRHETQHLHSRDNLRKALLNCLPFFGTRQLEKAWQEAAELEADDGAVSSRNEALDLAAALIKLTRHFPHQVMPPLATGLASGTDEVTARIERLIAWKETPEAVSKHRRYLIHAFCLVCLVAAVKFGALLAFVHSITERLVP